MRTTGRSVIVLILALLGAVVLGVAATLTSAATQAATTALIMGGTGTPDPADFPGYIPNVANYYIYPNTSCLPDTDPACDLVSVFTPETAWPLYGGLSALTWKDSILAGVDLFDAAVQEQLGDLGADDRIVLFGYSQSGAILAFEKIGLANNPTTKNQLEIVVIGNVVPAQRRAQWTGAGGLSIPIVEFPFGPPMPTDTGIPTTDIALEVGHHRGRPAVSDQCSGHVQRVTRGSWLRVRPRHVSGSQRRRYPRRPSWRVYAGGMAGDDGQPRANYPDIIDVQDFGDTTYITVTPKVLPLVQPLHGIGLTPLADLIEPALRVIIEETGYDRSIPYGQPTQFPADPDLQPDQARPRRRRGNPRGHRAGAGAASVRRQSMRRQRHRRLPAPRIRRRWPPWIRPTHRRPERR